MQKEILVATNNVGKYKEIKDLLNSHGIQTVSPQDLGIDIDPEETGDTLEANATLKALAFQKLASDRIVMADDTGLEIYALNNEPGIFVRRWRDKKTHMTDEEIIEYTLERMAGIPKEKRGGRFRTVIALAVPEIGVEISDGRLEGEIMEQPVSQRFKGKPFDSLFYVPRLQKILFEIQDLPKNDPENLTHRNKATLGAIPRIKELLK